MGSKASGSATALNLDSGCSELGCARGPGNVGRCGDSKCVQVHTTDPSAVIVRNSTLNPRPEIMGFLGGAAVNIGDIQ